ncbi:MAG TPA: hypothetical protein VGP72_27685 [Planctomycetota bacterium]|jgi:hypothetical protein
MTEQPKKHGLFQLHLSTCIVLMFAAGGLMWLQMPSKSAPFESSWTAVNGLAMRIRGNSNVIRDDNDFVVAVEIWNQSDHAMVVDSAWDALSSIRLFEHDGAEIPCPRIIDVTSTAKVIQPQEQWRGEARLYRLEHLKLSWPKTVVISVFFDSDGSIGTFCPGTPAWSGTLVSAKVPVVLQPSWDARRLAVVSGVNLIALMMFGLCSERLLRRMERRP